MSPDERRQPAWYKPHPEGVRRLDSGDIVEAASPGARPLVVPNPAFFDTSLAKTAMRLGMSTAAPTDATARLPRRL